jgi:hypothetical protein
VSAVEGPAVHLINIAPAALSSAAWQQIRFAPVGMTIIFEIDDSWLQFPFTTELSSREPVTFSIFRVFCTTNRMFLEPLTKPSS